MSADVIVSEATAEQIRDIQGQMLEHLKVLAGEDAQDRWKTIVVQQALVSHELHTLNERMEQTGRRLEDAVVRLNSAFWSLMKVPVAVVIIGVASWAFMYADQISENTWLCMIGVASFPWLGDSITAIANIIRGKKTDGS